MAYTPEQIKSGIQQLKARGEKPETIIAFVKEAEGASNANALQPMPEALPEDAGLRAPSSGAPISVPGPVTQQTADMIEAHKQFRSDLELQNAMGEIVPTRGVQAGLMRYVLPIGAGIAAGTALPAEIPALAGGAILSGIGAITSGLGEAGAQRIEAQFAPVDMNAVLHSTIVGGTPVKTTGGRAMRMMSNAWSAIATQEAANAAVYGASLDDYRKQIDDGSIVKRWAITGGISGGLSLLGGQGARLKGARDRLTPLQAERFGGTVPMMEYVPGMTELESRALKLRNQNARRLVDGMGANIGEAISVAYPGLDNTSDIAERLRTAFQDIKGKQDAWAKASERAAQLQEAANSIRQENPVLFAEMRKKAEEASFTATQAKALSSIAKDRWFGPLSQSSEDVAAATVSPQVIEMANAAKDKVKGVIDGLYAKANIGPNSPVMDVETFHEVLARHAAKSPLLSGDIARKEFVQDFEKLTEGKLVDGTLSREVYQNLQSDMAADLVERKMEPRRANDISAQRYAVIKEAADEYMFLRLPEEQMNYWRQANASYAKNIQEKEAGAMEMLRKGNIDQLVGSLQKYDGAGAAQLAELKSYSDVIRNTFDANIPGAKALADSAANEFERGINGAISKHVLNSVIDRGSGLPGVMDSAKFSQLAATLQEMKSKGFPNIEALGFGAPQDVQKIARLASARKNGFSKSETEEFFNLLPELGADQAGATITYRRAFRDAMIGSSQDRVKKTLAAIRLAKAVKLSEAEIKNEISKIEADPVVKFISSKGEGLNLGQTMRDDPAFIDRLMTVDNDVLNGFMTTFRTANPADAERLSKATAAKVMNHFQSFIESDARKIVNIFEARNLSDQAVKDNLRTLMGKDAFNTLQQKFIEPLKKIAVTELALGYATDSGKVPVNLSGKFNASGVVGGSSLQTMSDFVVNQRYNLAYKLYADPKWAPRFAKAGYSLDKFMASGPVERALVMALNDEDKREQAQKEARKAPLSREYFRPHQ
jgi:hypothetical protein